MRWSQQSRRPKASVSASVTHLGATDPAITVATAVIPAMDIITINAAFTIAPRTIRVTITAGTTAAIIDAVTGRMMIDGGPQMAG